MLYLEKTVMDTKYEVIQKTANFFLYLQFGHKIKKKVIIMTLDLVSEKKP